MNNLNSILDYLKVFNNIDKRKPYEPQTMAQEPRNMYAGGQLVRNTVDGSRPGYAGKKGMKQPNKIMRREYPSEQLDEFADAVLDSYAKDDITKIADRKYASNINRARINKYGNLDKLVKKTGLDEETIFNLLDDRDAYLDLEFSKEVRTGRPVEKGKAKFYKQAENWIVKNSKRYADPDKFKKAFIRTFGKDNDLIQKINKPEVLGRRGSTLTSVPFSEWFRTNIMGSSEQAMKGQVKPSYSAKQLDYIFKTAIYTNNENVRNKIIKELTDILPEKGSKRIPDIREKFRNSPILKKFGLNQRIEGPIARLLAKEVGDDLLKQVSLFRKPWLGTTELLTYLKDRVDPKYKSMFEETSKAVLYAQKNQWPEAKKALNISESIMFDHKIPKALMQLGYADDIEYIKVTPTSAEFNARIKNDQFDKPMIKLANQWEKAKTVDAKSKIVGDMNTLKDKFSKKYGNYLDDVKINVDKTGKPIFSSKTPVVTKQTDLVKSLETSLQHEKFPTMSEKDQMKFFKKMGYRCRKAGGAGEDVACYMSDVEQTRADMKSSDVTVRAKALTKQRKALQLASKIPQLKKILKTGVQLGTAVITKPLQALGLTSGLGYAIEGLVEGGFYDNARRKGYSHEQAMAETFTPGLLAGRPEDVPWYGGSEKLREKELIGDPQQNPKVKQYVDALKEQDRIYETIGAKEQAKKEAGLAETGFDATLLPADLDAASADVQDLARSGAYRRVDQTLRPESMASQAYNTAVENRDALDQRRRTEYLEKVEPRFLEREKESFDTKRHREKRYREMKEKFPGYSDEQIDEILAYYETSQSKVGLSYDQLKNMFDTGDKQAYYADNFRTEKAQGGIMSLKKKW